MVAYKEGIVGIFFLCLLVVSNCTRSGQDSDLATNTGKKKTFTEVKLTNLLKTSLETLKDGEVTVSMVEIPADTTLPRHYHPGEEFIYVIEGSGAIVMENKADTLLHAGDVFKVPYKQVHTARTGSVGVRAVVFRVHKKGEPERILVDR